MRGGGLVLAVLLTALAAARLVSIYAVGVNWDEFMLLDRAVDTAETGTLRSGGRSGLAVLVLMPFASGCEDEIATVRAARVLWLVITAAMLAGLALLLARFERDPRRRAATALLGVGLLALVPAFLEWSLQVRTDQIALLGGIWGGVALLASRRHPTRALLAGLLFGAGFLATQKLLYSAALVGLLVAADQIRDAEIAPRRDALRAALCAAGFGAIVLGFRALVNALFELPQGHASQQLVTPIQMQSVMSAFDFYRNTIGMSQYRELLPTLMPHGLLLVALAAASGVALRRRATRHAVVLALAWLLVFAGVFVGWFHAAAFSYFWMTLGLFPAVALAVSHGAVREILAPGEQRLAKLVTAGIVALIAIPALLQSAVLLRDTQSVQRESLHFIARNFAPSDGGFHPERGPFCREGSHRISPYFSRTLYRHFAGEHRERNQQRLLATFRREPIKYLVQSFRLNQFPVEVRRFWAENYQPYRASVFVAGRRLEGRTGAVHDFELIVPGSYRWLPAAGRARVSIDDRTLDAGAVVELTAGVHTAHFIDDVADGMLVLAMNDPPGPAPLAFYKAY